jgi:hypothetical protein
VKFDYKNFFVDLSAMTNIIPIDAKINTVNEGVKSVEENIKYNVVMLGVGYKFDYGIYPISKSSFHFVPICNIAIVIMPESIVLRIAIGKGQ